MVGIVYQRTPPSLRKRHYPDEMNPKSAEFKKRTYAKRSSRLDKRRKKAKEVNEMEEAAEALLSVSPDFRSRVPSKELTQETKSSGLSFLCTVASSINAANGFSLGPGVDGSLGDKGSLRQTAGQFKTPSTDMLKSILLRQASTESGEGDSEVRIGRYTLSERRLRLLQFLKKRENRVWVKKVRYSCRKNLADGRIRVKGRFVSAKKPPPQ